MKCKRNILSVLFGIWLIPLCGQIPDSISNTPNIPIENPAFKDTLQSQSFPADSVSNKKKKKGFIKNIFSKEDYPNPKKALYLSLAIPGGGQIYNKRWWKLPFVYGGYTLLGIALDFNTRNYKDFRDAYIAELANEPHPYSNTGLDARDLKRLRDGYDKNRQLSYIGFFALHLIQTAEAFVDCHLKTFDVSDDLSLKVKPTMGLTEVGTSYVGIGLAFELSK